MPRISSLATAASTLQAACDLVGEANGLNSLSLSRMKSYSGFGEGVCTCARCMRRAGPIREDVENKLVQITYALANVYDDSPDLDVRVTEEHRARAEEMMGCVESGDVTRLRDMFVEIEDLEAEGLLEPGTAPEIATYLIISAAQVGQAEIIRLLAEWDADMEETDSIRRGRPLMHAANNGHTAAAKALVECGADPEATDDNGYTALMVAVFSDRSSAAEALLDGNARVDTPDRAGRTALSYAAMYGSTDCIYLLAGRGADVGHVDADGNTPLELAEGSGRQSAVDALKKLQLRVKMQEKRKVKQSRTRGGCPELDAAELRAKEQEAARAAAELLEQLEKEEAAKSAAAKAAAAGSASASKKKKKGKGKAGSADADAADATQDSTADMVSAAHEHAPQQQEVQQQAATASKQQQQLAAAGKQQQPPRQQQQHAGLSNGRSGWDPQEPRRSSEDSSGQLHRQQHQQQPLKQEGLQQQHSLGRTSSETSQHHHHHRDVTTPVSVVSEHQLAPGTPGSSSLVGREGACAGSASESGGDEGGEALRREWEALLEAAARCKDTQQQPQMLARVSDLLPRCAECGISVKYGRKVLQRLQAVGPARKALGAALTAAAAGPTQLDVLEEALAAAKPCRCLLDDDLLQRAETKLAQLQEHQQQEERLQQQRQAEEQHRLQQQQQQQRDREEQGRQQQQQQREREAERQEELAAAQRKQQEALRKQQEQEATRKQQQQQEQARRQQQEQEQELQRQQQERARLEREQQARLKQEQAAAQDRAWQQQQQADQAAIAAATAAAAPLSAGLSGLRPTDDPISPRPPARQQSRQQPAHQQQQQLLRPDDPELPPQQLPSRQQQLQQLQQLQQQQQQPLSAALPTMLPGQAQGLFQQQQQLQQSRLGMLGVQSSAQQQQQQMVSSLQQQALAGLQGAASSALLSQQQQQERQLAMQLLEQAAAAQQTAMSSALPVGAQQLLQDVQAQQQLGQLQLLHQQQLFAAQLQSQVGVGGAQASGLGRQARGPGGLLGNGGPAPQGPGSLMGGGAGGLLGQVGPGGPGPQASSSQGGPTAVQRAQLQLQRQQQQLAGSYWGAAGAGRDAPLASPGGYGSVGQPSPGPRLSADRLAPPGPAMHSLARASSLGHVGGPGRGGRGELRGSGLGSGSLGGVLAPGGGVGVLGGGPGGPVCGGDVDMLDDHQHPAFSMASALLDDDEREVMVQECRLCGEGHANTCCLPCGCLCMCATCAGRWKQQDRNGLCPFCMRVLEDFAIVS